MYPQVIKYDYHLFTAFNPYVNKYDMSFYYLHKHIAMV